MKEINILPDEQQLWEGIAGHFDSLGQVIAEFIDNSVSNFIANECMLRAVLITINKMNDSKVMISVEDSGSGIIDLTSCFRLGDLENRESPLNEHGFGLKHALASANPNNDKWCVCTRTKNDLMNKTYKRIESPYRFKMSINEINENNKNWPGEINNSGTYIEFECSQEFFYTLRSGISAQAGFSRCLEYLAEDLGYIYSGIIDNGLLNITIKSNESSKQIIVKSIKPDWIDFYMPNQGKTELDLGGGNVVIEYEFGEMKASDYIRHYKRNMSTSGVEIRINGRLLVDNLFSEIWDIEKHNSYNHFLVRINIVSGNRAALPKTRTTKNGIRLGDPRFEKVKQWIRNTHPKPPIQLSNTIKENELTQKLAEYKEKHIPSDTKHIEPFFKVFTNLQSNVEVDLYVFTGSEVILYEAKKDYADIQDLYQLVMYWDGAVEDNLNPSKGILISSSFSPGVKKIIELFNNTKDREGKNYNFVLETWRDEGIEYPQI